MMRGGVLTELEQYNRGLKLKILSVSDIHLGHPTTPTEFIINNLNQYVFPADKETKDLDIIFIAGDVFDSLQDPMSTNSIYIRNWVAKLLYFCAENDIVLRVLKGTKFHDREQSYIFVEENINHSIGCDLKYIDTVSIEYNERFGIHVLYIPDEAHPTAAETWGVVEKLLQEHAIDKVDYAIMHGAFPHQLPDNIEEIKHILHDPEKYLTIVRHYIFIGHVHRHSIKDRIIAQGSTDRLCHGEEQPKGHVRVLKGKVKFIENKGAMRFITLEADDISIEDLLDKIRKLAPTDEPFHVRLRCSKDSVVFASFRRLTLTFPFIKFTFQTKNKTKKVSGVITKPDLKSLNTLTRDNLYSEIVKELKEHHPTQADSCSKIAEQLINVLNSKG